MLTSDRIPKLTHKINYAFHQMFADGVIRRQLKADFADAAASTAMEWLMTINGLPFGAALKEDADAEKSASVN